MKNIYRFLLVVFYIFANTNLLQAQWIQAGGPYGGKIMASIALGNDLFVGTEAGGVYRSTDQGVTWFSSSSGMSETQYVKAFAVSGTNIFAGTPNGVFLSTNNGDFWSMVNNGLLQTTVTSLAAIGTDIFAGTLSLGVFRSTNNGTNWTMVNAGLSDSHINALGSSGSTLIVATNGGVFMSDNNGATWASRNAGFASNNVNGFALDPPDILASTTGTGVYLSRNFGFGWNQINDGLTNLSVTSINGIGQDVYIGTNDGKVFWGMAGGAWIPVSGGLPLTSAVYSFAFFSGNNKVLAGTYGNGVYVSDYGVNNWTETNQGLTNIVPHSFLKSGSDIFAGTQVGLFKSADNGTSWTKVTNGFPNTDVCALGGSPGIFFAGTKSGQIYYSYDQGVTWNLDELLPSSVNTIDINHMAIAGTNGNGVYYWHNGTGWHSINTGLTNLFVNALLYDNGNLYAGTNNGIFTSNNNGANWVDISLGLTNKSILSLAVIDTNIFLGTNGNGVFITAPGGAGWAAVNTDLIDQVVDELYVSGTDLFAGTSSGVYRTTNNGEKWTNVNNGAAISEVESFVLSGSNILAGTATRGTWKRDLNDFGPSLNLTAPNGGENWRVGTSQNITWTSSNITNVKLEYTVDGGTNWNLVISSTNAPAGSYAWTIPNAVSGTVKVRISDVADALINDVSNANFAIYNPSVTLTAPNGGENWRVGTSQNITWTSNNIINVKLEYTVDNGTNWNVIIDSTNAAAGSYAWTIPNAVSGTVKVRVSDVLEAGLNDVSDANFAIYNPSVTLTAPNGGESWRVGTSQNITWTSNNIADVKLEYTVNNGVDWNLVVSSTNAPAGSYAWTIPNDISKTVKVRVSDVLEAGLNDVSDADFTIYYPSITLIAPNGGENWRVGNTELIKWVARNVANVKLEYTTNNGADWNLIVASADADSSTKLPVGKYTWTIPNTVSGSIKVRVSDVLEPGINDLSDADFSIYNPSVTLTAPNGGENWRVGTSQNITWTSNDITDVKLEYTIDNGVNWNLVVSSTNAPAGSYAWTVSNAVSGTVKVRVSDVLEAGLNDVSDANFTIYNPNITVTSPNGGENWRIGKQKDITWTSNNVVDVKIEYTINNGADWNTIIDTTPANAGSYTWTIPNNASANCKVRISDVLEPGLNDVSNNIFTIYSTSLALTSPNGGENWRVGTLHNITWNYTNISDIKIEYSSDNGGNWIEISASTLASAGSYLWTIPNSVSSNCIVRVTDNDEPLLTDVSNSVFSIYQPAVTLVTPNGGENWRVGTSQNITWTSNNITNVKIDYSTNNGTDWFVVASVPAVNATYAWTVPNTVSQICKIRISDVIEPALVDESNSVFTIYQPGITLNSPNGGENWRVGTAQNITWTSNDVTNIKIEYTTNNGSDWIVISNSVPANSVSYNWTIPNTVSANCKVKLSNADELSLNDVSNNIFTIYQPAITLNTPNGGENWRVGTTQNITWTSNNITNIKIEYTSNNGTDWNVVNTSVSAALGTYNWTIPNSVSADCKVRISDVLEPTMADESNATFIIYQPGVTLTAPNGGENWRVGTQKILPG